MQSADTGRVKSFPLAVFYLSVIAWLLYSAVILCFFNKSLFLLQSVNLLFTDFFLFSFF